MSAPDCCEVDKAICSRDQGVCKEMPVVTFGNWSLSIEAKSALVGQLEMQERDYNALASPQV